MITKASHTYTTRVIPAKSLVVITKMCWEIRFWKQSYVGRAFWSNVIKHRQSVAVVWREMFSIATEGVYSCENLVLTKTPASPKVMGLHCSPFYRTAHRGCIVLLWFGLLWLHHHPQVDSSWFGLLWLHHHPQVDSSWFGLLWLHHHPQVDSSWFGLLWLHHHPQVDSSWFGLLWLHHHPQVDSSWFGLLWLHHHPQVDSSWFGLLNLLPRGWLSQRQRINKEWYIDKADSYLTTQKTISRKQCF